MGGERSERGVAKRVAREALLNVGVLESLEPVCRCEIEDAGLRPLGEKAEEVAQVCPRLETVELAAGEQGHEDRVRLRSVIAADEEPVLASDGFAPKLPLAVVIVERQPTVLEEALERGALVSGVSDPLGDRRLVEDRGRLGVAPGKELGGDGLGVGLTDPE